LQDIGDTRGECKAHGNLGNVHLSLGQHTIAGKCYQEQLETAREIRDPLMEAQALRNVGISRMNLGRHEEAIGCFEQQLAALEQTMATTAQEAAGGTISAPQELEKGRAFGNLGTCYDCLGDYDEAVVCHEKYLAVSLKNRSVKDQDRAYRELGHAHRSLGNLQQALVNNRASASCQITTQTK
jgi:tetratricopeptide (TPR) repeat protein